MDLDKETNSGDKEAHSSNDKDSSEVVKAAEQV